MISFSQDEAVIAADSRAMTYPGHRDDDCKIMTYNNKLVIASSGLRKVELDYGGRKAHWDSQEVVHKSIVTINEERLPIDQDFVSTVAHKWAELALNTFEPLAAVDPQRLEREIPHPNPMNEISGIIFVGLGHDGKVTALHSSIYFDLTRGPNNPVLAKRTDTLPPDKLAAMGSTSIIKEFASPADRLSPRARSGLSDWNRAVGNQTDSQKRKSWVIQLV